MKKIIMVLFVIVLMITGNSTCNHQYEIPVIQQEFTLVLPTKNKPLDVRIYNAYLLVGERLKLDNLITISAQSFAKAATIVAYCESDFNSKSIKLDQQGIAQITKDTRTACNIPDQLNLTIEDQVYYHEQFLRKCSTKALRAIKSSVDFHALNFAPSRTFSDTLSKVSNKWLAALDFTKDNIITREDFEIFQAKKIKQSTLFIRDLYNDKTL